MRMPLSAGLIALSLATLSAQPAAGLRWATPAGWKTEAARAMRLATYSVAAEPGSVADAECAVYFFGAGQGGSVDANIERWTGQFTSPSGKPATPIVGKRTVHGLAMTTIDVAGAYSGLGGPTAVSKSAPGYRLLGAVVEAPGGNVFVKFTGPARTIAANKAKFDQLLASFTKS